MAWLWDKEIRYRDKNNSVNKVPLVANKTDIESGELVPIIAKDGTKVYVPFTDEVVMVTVKMHTSYKNTLTAPFNFKAEISVYLDEVTFYSRRGYVELSESVKVHIDLICWYNGKESDRRSYETSTNWSSLNWSNMPRAIWTDFWMTYSGTDASIGKFYTECYIILPDGTRCDTLFRIENANNSPQSGSAFLSSKNCEKFLDYYSYLANNVTQLKLRKSANSICWALQPYIAVNYTTTEKRRTESGNYTTTYYDGFELSINLVKTNVKLPVNCYITITIAYSYTPAGPYGSPTDGKTSAQITLGAGNFSVGGKTISTGYNVAYARLEICSDTYKNKRFWVNYFFDLTTRNDILTFPCNV